MRLLLDWKVQEIVTHQRREDREWGIEANSAGLVLRKVLTASGSRRKSFKF
jgi:hypothetical protein